MAKLVMTPEAADQLEDLPVTIHQRVLKLLDRLARWPAVSGAKPLRHGLAGRYRLRTGDYRVQFHAPGSHGGGEDVVIVEKIGHRDGFYED